MLISNAERASIQTSTGGATAASLVESDLHQRREGSLDLI